MDDEPTWAELLVGLFVMASIPTVIGGAIVLSLIGLTMWITAPLRGRRRKQAP